MIPLIFPKVPQSSLGILRVWNRHNLTFKQVKNVEAEEVPNFGLRVQAVYKHPRNKNIMFNICLYIYIYIYRYTIYMITYAYNYHVYIYIFIHMYVHIHIYIYKYVCIHMKFPWCTRTGTQNELVDSFTLR